MDDLKRQIFAAQKLFSDVQKLSDVSEYARKNSPTGTVSGFESMRDGNEK